MVRTDVPMTNLAVEVTFDQRMKLVRDLSAYLRENHPDFQSVDLAVRVEHTVNDKQFTQTVGVIMRWLEDWLVKP